MRHATLFLALLIPAVLTGCTSPTPEDYANRGDPEALLSTSSEVVSFDLSGKTALSDLKKLVREDPPTKATLNCAAGKKTCTQAMELLAKNKIPTQQSGSGNDITMVYERILARDCDSRYVDNSSNPYNLNYSAFGCSLQANTVQMVTDRNQFVTPALLDYYDGEKAAQNYQNYSSPPDNTGSQSGSSSNGSLLSGATGQ